MKQVIKILDLSNLNLTPFQELGISSNSTDIISKTNRNVELEEIKDINDITKKLGVNPGEVEINALIQLLKEKL